MYTSDDWRNCSGSTGTGQLEVTATPPDANSSLATTTSDSWFDDPQQVSTMLWRVVPPVILALGTVGNVLAVAVVRSTTSSRSPLTASGVDQSMAVYLTSLALCDLAVLWLGLTRRWAIAMFQVDVRGVHLALCKLHKFLIFSLGRSACWILVAVTSERVTSVMWPLRRSLRGTRRKAIKVVAVILFLCCLTNVDLLVMYTFVEMKEVEVVDGDERDECQVCSYVRDHPGLFRYHEDVFPWINIVLGALLPIFLLVVNNILLAATVRRSAGRAVRASRSVRALAVGEEARDEWRETQASTLTVTVVVTSATFLLLVSSIPVGFFVRRFYVPTLPPGPRLNAVSQLTTAVPDLLWYCNSAANFYLYCLTGTKFRKVARRIVCRCTRLEGRGKPRDTQRLRTISVSVC